ncbi:MAG: hypothetical protein WD069_12250 [Planctomycetales bacterium]
MTLRRVVLALLALAACGAPAQAQFGPDRGGPDRGYSDRGYSDRGVPDRGGVRTDQYLPPGQYLPHGQTAPQYTYRFGGRGHLARLAGDLETQANEVCWEMYRNYRLSRNWDETYRQMYQILQDAKHIRQLVREQYRGANNQDHIADDLHDVDQLFDRTQRRVARWEPDRSRREGDFRPVHDVRDLRDPRNQQPVSVSELQRKLQQFDGTLHHMMVDYGVKTRLEQRAEGRYGDGPGRSDAPPPRP